jgi:hypothetical protein
MGVGGQHQTPATLPSGRDLVPIVQETGWAAGPVCTGAENLPSHRDSIPGLSARSEDGVRCGNLYKEEIV